MEKARCGSSTRDRPAGGRLLGSDGFIIVAVLWILGALATLASIYAVYVIDTAIAFSVHDDRLEAQALISAGLELTAQQVTAQPVAAQQARAQQQGQQPAAADDARPSHGAFNFRLGRANVAVQFQAESARIDLNAAPKELLVGLFAALGAREAEAYADRVVGWRSLPPEGQDSELELYRTAGRRYAPRGAPFPHAGELWLVMGLPEAIVERAMPFVTVYSGQKQVNVLEAAPEVLAALPGMTPDRLHDVLRQRAATPQNGQLLLSLLGPAQTHAGTEVSKTMRVAVAVNFDNGRRIGAEAVILIDENDGEPYRVLWWRDDFDDPRP